MLSHEWGPVLFSMHSKDTYPTTTNLSSLFYPTPTFKTLYPSVSRTRTPSSAVFFLNAKPSRDETREKATPPSIILKEGRRRNKR
jgi:hypothetical protein